jgi:lariat debranching enzyme
MITHDWPLGIYNHGDCTELLRFKPFLANEIQTNTLGSPENEQLLKKLKPKYWFSAHLHVKFACVYKHDSDEHPTTKFLSLDKCLPRRRFLQVIEFENTNALDQKHLSLDPEWMCILKKTDSLLSVNSYNQAPISAKEDVNISASDLNEIKEDFQECFEIPPNFKQTAPAHQSGEEPSRANSIKEIYLNEQTTLLCEMLNIRDPVRVLLEKKGQSSLITESATQMYNNLLDESDNE